ncbi:hypothetical protein [Ruminococcus albus]|uniref:Prepilin-type cleavage/methylation N-terminal domain protein n=1 Tax=Ruminococcus albus 8 TaxID=246199 RepID=E9SGX3_RUMAL|nr:hypothetical protein [Ruminococcus albus]EGC01444.1 prepilin-type cleavage/methylation N-terminal domain protein [Ruminococcus albus 8]MCC3350971.1 hypothetical protein [Ruminococcus albus 8]
MNRKGISILGVMLALAVVAVGAAAIYVFTHRGSGTGSDGAIPAVAPIELNTDQMEYLEVTIDGSDYYLKDEKAEIADIISAVEEDDDLSAVRITDKGASQKAFRELVSQLEEHKIKYIEGDENE